MYRFGEIGQWVGMAAAVAGLIVEIVTKADVGYAVLTGGSLAWGIFTKVKYYRGKAGKDSATHQRLR